MFWLTNNNNLSVSLAALVVWGFLMVFLFNLLMRFTSDKKDNLLLFSSFIMFLSYFTSDDLFNLFALPEIYITWFIYDVVTLGLIAIFYAYFRCNPSVGVKYLYLGLSLNSFLFLAMHIDIVITGNKERWILWDLYSIGVNLIDFMMIFALILDKDYLGIFRFYKFITSPIRKKALI